MSINLDFRLLEVSMELIALEKHLELIESQIEQQQKEAQSVMEAKIFELGLDSETEWDLPRQEFCYYVDSVLPRVLRNPFLVSLFAVYESAVTEIAKLIQAREGTKTSICDLNGRVLKRYKKYYENVLQFQLSLGNDSWQRLILLSDLRNVIAHTNGRLDLVDKRARKEILMTAGVKDELGYLVVEGDFLKETFALVKEDLEGLIRRYKEWDTTTRP